MRTLIVDYSRTGTTGRLARTLQDRLGATRAPIRCARYRGGALSFLRAGLDSLLGRLPRLDPPTPDMGGLEAVVLACPVWTGHPATPMRAFLAARPALPDRVGLVLAFGSNASPETALAEFADLLPRPPTATLALPQEWSRRAAAATRSRASSRPLAAIPRAASG